MNRARLSMFLGSISIAGILIMCLVLSVFAVNETEPNNSMSTAMTLTVHSVIEGEIGESETADFYKVTPTAAGRVTVTFTSYMEYYRLLVLDNTGNEVFNSGSQNYNTQTMTRTDEYHIDLEARTYYFKVDGEYYGSHKGLYNFTMTFEDAEENIAETNDSISQAKTIQTTGDIHGIIALDETDDYFKIMPKTAGRVSVLFTSRMEYYRFLVFDNAGNQVFNSGSLNYNTQTLTRTDEFHIDLEARTYYFKVDGEYYGSHKGLYNFSMTFESANENIAEPNDSIAQAKTIQTTGDVHGIIALDETDDYFKITPVTAGRVTVIFTSRMDYYRFLVFDSTGKEVFNSGSLNYNTQTLTRTDEFHIDLEARTYYFKVDGEYYGSHKGLYNFSMTFESANENIAEPNDSITQAKTIQTTGNVNGIIALDETDDYFKITPVQSGRVTLTFTSFMDYYRFLVFDNTGKQVFNSGSLNYNSQTLTRTDIYNIDLEARTYYFKVDGEYYGSHKGLYHFAMTFTGANANVPEPNDSFETAKSINLYSTVKGIIALDEEGDYFKFSMPSSAKIPICFNSGLEYYRFIIFDKDGKQVFNTGSVETSGNKHEVELDKGSYVAKVDGEYYGGHYGIYSFSIGEPSMSVNIEPTVGYAFVSFGSNATVSVTASGGAAPYTYAWYYKDVGASAFSKSSVSTASYSYPITSARNGRTVYCVVTDKNGTSVKSPSIPMFAPEIATSVTVKEGVICNFAVKSLPTIGSPYTYAWYYKDPGQSSYTKCQSTTGSVSFNGIAGRDGRQVYCLVKDKNGTTAKSNVATMHVIKSLAITTQPKNVTVSAGINATFSVTASGTGLTYAWYYKDTGASAFSKSASTSNSVTYTTSMDRNGRKVYCVVTDKNGNTEKSNTVTLTVVAAPKITAQPKNVTVSAGINATFSVTASGTGLTYAWYYKDPGASAFSKSASTSNSVTYTTSMDRNGRKVYCVVTDKYGNTVKSNTVTLTVVAAPKITAQPKNVTVNAGTNATFSVTATGTGLTYAWYYKDPSASAFSKSASTTNSVTYSTSADRNGRKVYCVVTDKYGNTVKSNTVTLTVVSGLAITSQPKNVTVKAGTNATFSLTATGSGLSYFWYYKDKGSTTFTKSASTTNSVTYTTSAARNGRQVYCRIIDAEGNTVKSNTVTLTVQ